MNALPPAAWIGRRVTVARSIRYANGEYVRSSVTGTLAEVDQDGPSVVLRDMTDGSSGPVALDCPPHVKDAAVTLAAEAAR